MKNHKGNGEWLGAVFDALPDAIIVLDSAFTIIAMNDSAENIFKISREKASGRHCFSVIPKEIQVVALKSLEEERSVIGDSVKASLRDGQKVSLQAVASPILGNIGGVDGIVLQVKDLAGAEFLNERNLQQVSSSALEGLILGLAHELKNPLSGIRGAAQILLEEAGSAEIIKCARIIIKEADRLRSLLDTMKRLEPFAKEIFEPVNVNEILTEVLFLESKSLGGKGVKFTHSFDVALPPVSGDANSLKQAILNLVRNAIEAIEDRGEVYVSTRWITDYKLKNENAISIYIRDSGAGISKESLEKIFSPFYTTKKNGTGLGLFLAYQIVAKHGGAIFVESQPGRGTLFKVYLPIYEK
ncbi:MAG: two-component system sensor histidine kinase NtrB [Deltaproteobacteria bacterium]